MVMLPSQAVCDCQLQLLVKQYPLLAGHGGYTLFPFCTAPTVILKNV